MGTRSPATGLSPSKPDDVRRPTLLHLRRTFVRPVLRHCPKRVKVFELLSAPASGTIGDMGPSASVVFAKLLSDFGVIVVRSSIVKAPYLKPDVLLTRVYENSREPNCEGIREIRPVRRLRTRVVTRVAGYWAATRSSNRFIRGTTWLAPSLLQTRVLRNLR